MIEQPHRPTDRTLTVQETRQPDAETRRASVRPYRPALVRPIAANRPVDAIGRTSGSADVDLFRPSVPSDPSPAPDRSRSADPSGFGFAGPDRPRTPAAPTVRSRVGRAPQRPSRAPHIAVAVAVPAAGVAGFFSALLSTGLPMQIFTFTVIGSVVLIKLAGPVRAVVALLAALIAKIGSR